MHQSLALCYRNAVGQLRTLTRNPITSRNIVSGGSQNATLNQLTANATGLPVFAGSVEATALGNLAAQWMATNKAACIDDVRALIAGSIRLEVYQPQH